MIPPEPGGDPLELVAVLLARGRSVAVRARGGSMRPALRDGDVITLGPLDRAPRRGEVVAARRGSLLIIHRVVRVIRVIAQGPGGVALRGDACAAGDGVFSLGELLGRAISVRRGGERLSRARLGGRGGRALGLLRPLTRAALRVAGLGRRLSDPSSRSR